MHQIKVFKGIENDLGVLESEVNKWLIESGVHVVNMFGNLAPQSSPSVSKAAGLSKSEFPPSDILLVILYEPVPK
jgi:hypothetical protein